MKPSSAISPLLGLLVCITGLAVAGCSSVGVPGSARYFSNQPKGEPYFRVSAGLGAPTIAVRKPDGKWTKARTMKKLGANDPLIASTPGLAELVENAYQVDDYAFMEFRADAKDHGQPLPSRYFLYPGGFAYLVSPKS